MDRDTIDALKDPSAWPHPVTDVKVIETHASWVFLTGDFAYKVKKPVNFGFLDFSSLDKRLHCCREELRLNRRLAPDLYLDVVPIAGSPPRVGGNGAPIEYAVKMRQFDTECGFDRLAQRGELDTRLVDDAAVVLAAFHAEIPRASEDSGFGRPADITGQVLENFQQMATRVGEQAPGSRDRFAQLEQWSRNASDELHDEFAARLAGGFVRECHGDLHLRNIVWWQGRVIPFDCIEFNPSLRWIDVMSELAFLLMDLDDHGLPGVSTRLLNVYLEYGGDFAGLKLLRFYQAYRAMVRAKVESLRLAQLDTLDPELVLALEGYMKLAERYTQSRRPKLLIAHGLSGSGKTYVSRQLLEKTPFIRLRSDVERKRLFGLSPLDPSSSAPGAGIYSSAASERVYGRLETIAAQLLADGWTVLVDATFLEREARDRFRRLAESCDVPFAIMHCEADLSVQRQRVADRKDDASEAKLDILERQLVNEQPLEADEKAVTLSIDTTGAPDLEGLLGFLEADAARQ